jgi:hypothetical protein
LPPLDVGVEPAEDAEQLVAAVAQRAADHAGAGREARLELSARGGEPGDAQVGRRGVVDGGHGRIVPHAFVGLRARNVYGPMGDGSW